MSLLDAKACEVVSVVEACEGGGFGGGGMLPSEYLSQTKFYHNVRGIVLHEKWKMDKKKSKKEGQS